MKTPEQMAEEYVAHNRSYPYDPLNAQDRYMRNSYLVGYQAAKDQFADAHIVTGETSDGYHTFNDLYEHRILLFLAALKAGAFKAPVVCEDHYPDWDVITCYTPNDYAQISYHLPVKYRYLYKHLDRCSKEQQENNFDGHHSKLVAQRIEKSLSHTFLPTPAKWISVKERLPEIVDGRFISDDVLWISTYGEMHVSCLEKLRSKLWVDWGEAGLLKLDQVTHWMPLPKPPEDK